MTLVGFVLFLSGALVLLTLVGLLLVLAVLKFFQCICSKDERS